MDKSMISLSQEIERVKAELAGADKRANAAAAGTASNTHAEADKRVKVAVAATTANTLAKMGRKLIWVGNGAKIITVHGDSVSDNLTTRAQSSPCLETAATYQ
ncbi:hypothetical protein Tco_1389027, partial [Tanacetum coccineum]